MLRLAVETYENGVGTGAEKDYLVDPNDESFIWWNVGSKTKHLVLRVYLMHANGSRIALPDGESLPIASSLIFMNDEFVPDQYQSRPGTGSGTKGAPIFQILIEDSILSIIGNQPALIRFRINEVSSSRMLGGSKINPKKFRVLVFVHGRTDITPTRSACIEVKSKTNNVKKSVRPDDEVAGGAVDKKKQKVDLLLNFALIPAPVQFGSSSSNSSDPSAIRRRMEETIVHTIDIFQNSVMNTMIQSGDGRAPLPHAAMSSLVTDINSLRGELLAMVDRELTAVDGRQSARSEAQSTSRSEARSEDLRVEKEGLECAGLDMPPPSQARSLPKAPLGSPLLGSAGASTGAASRLPGHGNGHGSGSGNGHGVGNGHGHEHAHGHGQEGMEVDGPLGDVNRQESDEIFRHRALAIVANSIRSSTTSSSSSSISIASGRLSPRAPTTATAAATAAAAATMAAGGGYPPRLPVSSNSSGLDSFDEAFHALDEIVFPSSAQISRQGTREERSMSLSEPPGRSDILLPPPFPPSTAPHAPPPAPSYADPTASRLSPTSSPL